jgi:hypothetical protein
MATYNPTYRRRFSRPSGNDYRAMAAAAATPPAKPTVTGNLTLWSPVQTIRDPKTGATKTTRVLELAAGCLVNTCTRTPVAVAEALCFIPGARLADFNGPPHGGQKGQP